LPDLLSYKSHEVSIEKNICFQFEHAGQCDRPAYNMGFSAMLAEEYKLIVPFAYQLQFGLNE
jgi:hypothetical protein